MVKLQEAEKDIVVLPYAAENSNLKLLKTFPEDIPSGISTLKKYFQNATPRMNGESYYIRALLFYNKPFEEITEDIKWWLGEQKAGIWLRKVQEEKVANLGYLLYSLRTMDAERLTRTFSYRYGTKVGIRYRVISTGRRGKYDPNVELPRAIHLEVAEGEAGRVSRMLQDDYASNHSSFPMGIKMRFVPDINQVMNFTTRTKSKTSKALTRLNLMFQQKDTEMTKIYWAIVSKCPRLEEEVLTHYLLKNEERNKSNVFDKKKKNAKEAVLEYKLITRSQKYFLLEVKLHTGRHHQIRAQLARIGCPIRGDLKYGYPRSNKGGGIDLHAREISFIHPVKHERVTIKAPIPKNDNLWKELYHLVIGKS